MPTPLRYHGFSQRKLTEKSPTGKRRLSQKGKNLLLGKRIREIRRIFNSPNPVLTTNPNMEKARTRVWEVFSGKRPAIEIYEAMHDVILEQLKRKLLYHRNLVNLINYSKKVYDHYSIHFKNERQFGLAHEMLNIYRQHKEIEYLSLEGLQKLEYALRESTQLKKMVETGQLRQKDARRFIAFIRSAPPQSFFLEDPKSADKNKM
ncbi:MAG: hypothetical protein Q8P05_03425 [Candidatus Diapherotrites archaeon]|nr:hypothetical protein [Candidatus Diapherotrites archaeon]